MRLDVEYLNPFFTRRLTQEVSLPYFLEEEKLVELVVVLSTTQGATRRVWGQWDICVLLIERAAVMSSCSGSWIK